MKFEVRKAVKTDAYEIMLVEAECFDENAFSKSSINYYIKAGRIFVAIDEEFNGIAGYICVSPISKSGRQRIYSLAVRERYRGQGIAKRLLSITEDNTKATELYLEVDAHNKSAIRLYKMLGYYIFGIYKDYYGDDKDALRMQKII